MKRNLKSFLAGQSLAEVVIALAVTVLLVLSLISTILYVQKSSRIAKNKTQATKLALEDVEQIRIMRDRSYDWFDGSPIGGCFSINSTHPDPLAWTLDSVTCATAAASAPAVVLDNTTFRRWVTFSDATASKKKVTVYVTWTDDGGSHTYSNETFISKVCPGTLSC